MDAAGSERAALVGVSEGGPLNPDYPYGTKPDEWRAMLERMEQGWGKGVLLSAFARQ